MSEALMKDANTVVINGAPAGGLVDAVLNNRDDAAAIHDAFMAWLVQHDAELVAAEQAKAADEARLAAAQAEAAAADQQAMIDKLTSLKDQFRQSAENWQARYQEAATANQKLNAKIQELQGQLIASTNMATQVLLGTTEQAVAAARENNRLNALAMHAAATAQLAELERSTSEANHVEQPAA